MTATMTHREAWEAIPWLVNGTLGADEAHRLRAHAGACPSCAAEIAEQQGVGMRIARTETPAPDVAAAWARMEAELRARGVAAAGAPATGGALARLLGLVDRVPGPFSPAAKLGGALAAAAVLAVVVLPGEGTDPRGSAGGTDRPAYETLTSGGAGHVAEGGVELRVIASPQAAPERVRAALEAAGATRVAEPSPSGLVRATVPEERRETALAALRADPMFLVVAAD